jgi:hypothetical protein
VLENFDMENCKPKTIPTGFIDKLPKGSKDQEWTDFDNEEGRLEDG